MYEGLGSMGGATMLGEGIYPPPFETRGVRGDKKI